MTKKDIQIHEGGVNVFANLGLPDADNHFLKAQIVAELYRLTLPDEEPKGLTPNYNVAPTTVMPIIRPAGNGRGLVMELTRSISLASRNSAAAGVAGRALSRTSHPAASWHGRGST